MTQHDHWDDDRLDAAFASRADAHPTPTDLTVTTVDAIRTGAKPRTSGPGRPSWPLAAAAAVVFVLGGITLAGLAARGPDRGAPTASNPSTADATNASSPSAATATWPPDGATMVVLPGAVGVAVVDASARLVGARDASVDCCRLPLDPAPKQVHLAPTTTPGEVLLTWSGSGCDVRATVRIDVNLEVIAVERLERPACDGEARGFGVILVFDGPVDVDAIDLSTSLTVAPGP